MTIDLRPSWCPDDTCICLDSYDEAMCIGRLPEKQEHPGTGIYNTHQFCGGAHDLVQINDEDMLFYSKLMQSGREDVEKNRLYRPPGYRDTWDFEGVT